MKTNRLTRIQSPENEKQFSDVGLDGERFSQECEVAGLGLRY